MASAGIRELKDNLSRYIRRIEAGERIAITAHGRVVAELVPPGSTSRLDVVTLIDDYRSRLASREGDTLARLVGRFPDFWNDNAMIRADHLSARERDLILGKAVLTPLTVVTDTEESFGGRTPKRELQRTQGSWRLVFDSSSGTKAEEFSTREEAADRAVELAAELYR